jgi:hypothetical protein
MHLARNCLTRTPAKSRVGTNVVSKGKGELNGGQSGEPEKGGMRKKGRGIVVFSNSVWEDYKYFLGCIFSRRLYKA